jgi:hypothetical protein
LLCSATLNDIFLRKVCSLSTEYTALFPWNWCEIPRCYEIWFERIRIRNICNAYVERWTLKCILRNYSCAVEI